VSNAICCLRDSASTASTPASAGIVAAVTGSRTEALERLGEREFDVLVVGGGIVGAGIAEAATAHGLSVALVDKGDFAGATSSASSKLVHGGLRYLAMGDVRLVREAHAERRVLMQTVAPHLVQRLRFVFPFYPGGPYSPWFVQSGILLYSALARSRLHRPLTAARARALVPPLQTGGLRTAAIYADAWTNDGRLTIANLRAAADRGAVVLNYAEVTAVSAGEATVSADGGEARVRARRIVNATGPWVDRLRLLEDDAAAPSIRLSKGVHVVVEGGEGWGAAVTVPQEAGRVSFAIPWEGMLLLGTTDTLHEDGPDQVEATPADVTEVLREASTAIGGLGPVRTTFAGLRALPLGAGSTTSARREVVFSTGPTGMVSVAGGKLTTYRRIALDALAHAGVTGLDRRPRPLPGATGLDGLAWPRGLEPATRAHLLRLYGSLASEVLAPALEDPSLLEPLVPDRPDVRAQEAYARAREWAVADEDVLRRRTTAWLGAAPALVS
jgi:glycerol-3-phosphate dehydrogenase